MGGDLPMTTSGGSAGYSHQADPHHPLVSTSASLQSATLFLSHLSTTYLLIIDASGVFLPVSGSLQLAHHCMAAGVPPSVSHVLLTPCGIWLVSGFLQCVPATMSENTFQLKEWWEF